MAIIVFAFIVSLTFYLIKLCIDSVMFISQFDDIPGPRPRLPILGNSHWTFDINFFKKPLNEFLIEKIETLVSEHKNNGYVIGIFMNRVYLVVFKPQLVSELLTKVHNKMSEFKLFKEWLGNSLFFSDFSEWKRKRKLLNPCFKSTALNGHISIVNETLDDFIDKIGKQTKEEYFDIKPLVYEWNLRTVLATQFGINPAKITDDCRTYVENVENAQNKFAHKMVHLFKWFRFLYDKSKAGKSLRRVIREINEFGRNLIMNRKKNMKDTESISETHSFLDRLLKLQRNGASITDEDIRAEVDTFIVGGFETSATTLLWTMLVVANNPEVQETLKTELRVVIGDDKRRHLTKEDLSKLVYTECVIKETLRLFTVSHTILREAETDFFFDGHKYPKNTAVCMLLFKSHRDKDTFVNADSFIPERFLDPKTNSAFHAFGGGSRDCIGRQFAMNNMKMFVAKIFLNFELKAKHKPNEVRPNYLGALRPSSQLLLNVKESN